MNWYNFTNTITKPPGTFLEWADIILVNKWVSEWVSECEWMSEWVSEWVSNRWVSRVFIRKGPVLIEISTNFKWRNSGGGAGWWVENVTIKGVSLLGGQFFRGQLGPWRTLWKPFFSKFKVFMTVSPKSIKPVKLPVFD